MGAGRAGVLRGSAPLSPSRRAKEYPTGHDSVPVGVGLVGQAAAEGRPMWTEDFRADDRFVTRPDLRERNAAVEIVAGLAVPLRVAGHVIGVLSVGHPMPRACTEAGVELFQSTRRCVPRGPDARPDAP